MPRKTTAKAKKPAAPRKPKAIKAPKASKLKVQARATPADKGLKVQPINVRIGEFRVSGEPMRRPVNAHFDIQALSDDVTVIDVYDVIGDWALNARTFREALRAVKTSTIQLRINSPGGSVFDAVAMYNDLIAHPARVEVQIVGLAASAASILAMAGNSIEIADNAFIMIHNSWSYVVGDRREMASAARTLERVDNAMRKTYAARSGLAVEEIGDMMDAETWLDAGDAVAMGFADTTTDTTADAQAAFDLSVYVKVPDVLKGSSTKAKAKPVAPQVAPSPDFAAVSAALARLEATLKGTLNATSEAPGTNPPIPVAA